MSSIMVFGALALAAVFAVSFLWASHLARNTKEEADGLRGQIRTAHEERNHLETALTSAKSDSARQRAQVVALELAVQQHTAVNQQLRDALAEAGVLKEEMRRKLMEEIGHSRQLSERLTSALAAMNDVSQTITEMAERHRGTMQKLLLDPAPAPAVLQAPAPDPDHQTAMPQLQGGPEDPPPQILNTGSSGNGLGMLQTLNLGDDHPLLLALSQRAQAAEAVL